MRLKPKSTVHNPRALLYKRFTDLESAEAFRVIYRTNYLGEEVFWVFDTQAYQFKRANNPESAYQKTIPVDEYTLYRYNNFAFRFTAKRENGQTIYVWERIDVSTITEDGADISISLYIGLFGEVTDQPFTRGVSLEGVLTKPLEEVYVEQKNGIDFEDCYVNIFMGATTYSYGEPNTIPSGSKQTLLLNETYANTSEWSNYLLIGGIVTTIGEIELSATVSFKAKGLDLLSALYNDIARYQTNKYYLAGSFDYMIRGSIGSSDTQPIKGNIMHLRSFEIKYFDDSINIDHDDLVVIDGRLYGVEELAYDIKRSPKPYTIYFATLNNIK